MSSKGDASGLKLNVFCSEAQGYEMKETRKDPIGGDIQAQDKRTSGRQARRKQVESRRVDEEKRCFSHRTVGSTLLAKWLFS